MINFWDNSNKAIEPDQNIIRAVCTRWAPKNLPLSLINLALPDHQEYLDPTNLRFFKWEIRIQLQLNGIGVEFSWYSLRSPYKYQLKWDATELIDKWPREVTDKDIYRGVNWPTKWPCSLGNRTTATSKTQSPPLNNSPARDTIFIVNWLRY